MRIGTSRLLGISFPILIPETAMHGMSKSLLALCDYFDRTGSGQGPSFALIMYCTYILRSIWALQVYRYLLKYCIVLKQGFPFLCCLLLLLTLLQSHGLL